MTLIRVILIKIAIFLALGVIPSTGVAQVEEEKETASFDEVAFRGNWGLILEEGTSPGIKTKAQKAETLAKLETRIGRQQIDCKISWGKK